MHRIVILILEFISALQHLKHCCHIIGTVGTEHSVSASNHCNSHVHGYGKKAYILKYLLDFKNNLINIGCATLYHLSMTYITVNNLSINSNHRILAAELNYRFTRSFNFQQLFFYDIFFAQCVRYFTSYRSSKYTTVNRFFTDFLA